MPKPLRSLKFPALLGGVRLAAQELRLVRFAIAQDNLGTAVSQRVKVVPHSDEEHKNHADSEKRGRPGIAVGREDRSYAVPISASPSAARASATSCSRVGQGIRRDSASA
jgi:hypothetical protein